MTARDLLLAVDQGTTSTRTICFDSELRPLAAASRPVETLHPVPGWVEADPIAIERSVIDTVAEVLQAVGGPDRIAAVGIDNQGETVVAWDAETLEPLAPAIVWQCRRSASIVERVRATGVEAEVRAKTGLPLDPYFSAGKLTWLLEECAPVRAASRVGTLRFGTVDAWLTARLGDDPVGRTDHSTASRTQLFDLATLDWDDGLLRIFGVERAWLPRIAPTMGGETVLSHPDWGAPLRVTAMVCDQQAALCGHAGFAAGSIKATYGTGVFVLANAGGSPTVNDAVETSVGWTRDGDAPVYVVQGGVLSAGTLLDWLRDDLGIVADVAETERMARSVADSGGVLVLPALTGLGAPWYRATARGVIAGLTPATTPNHVVRAALDGICHRVCDVVDAMLPVIERPSSIRVDGGLTANRYLIERQADLLGVPIEVPSVLETTALGTAALCGMADRVVDLETLRAANPIEHRVEPRLSPQERRAQRSDWRRFVELASAL